MKALALTLLVFLSSVQILQAQTTKKSYKKARRASLVKKWKRLNKKSARKKVWHIEAAYEYSTFDEYSNTNNDNSKELAPKGVQIGLGYNFILGPRLSTTTSAQFTYGKDTITYRNIATTEKKHTVHKAELRQSINLDFKTKHILLRPFIEGGIGMGYVRSDYKNNSVFGTMGSLSQKMKGEGLSTSMALGLKGITRRGFTPFIKANYTMMHIDQLELTQENYNSFTTPGTRITTLDLKGDEYDHFTYTMGIGFSF